MLYTRVDSFFVHQNIKSFRGGEDMTLRRLEAAAAAMLLAVYLKLSMPVFSDAVVPALKEMLIEEQIVITVPEEVTVWLGLD